MYRYCTYPVEIKQKYLRLSIQNGQNIIDMRRAVDRWCQIGKNEKMIDVNDAVLCILHLELRCSKKKVGNLLNDGFLHRKQAKLVKEYIEKVENVVNKGKIGLSSHQNQWRFPSNAGNDGVATDFSLKGEVSKNILSKSDRLIPIALQYHSKSYRDEWKIVLSEYQRVLDILNGQKEFPKEDILEFQQIADNYSNKWANLTGRDGQTNYKHFI